MNGIAAGEARRSRGMEAHRTGLEAQQDLELLRRAREADDPQAFKELYRRHREPVLGFLSRLLGEPQAAEDVLQETFLRVHQHMDRHDLRQPFRPWLFRIARNLGINALRAKGKPGRATGGEATGAAATSDRVPRDAARSESRDAARAALEALPAETRALLIQRHGLGMKLEELAASWEVNERTIRTRLQAAVDQLTQALLAQRAGGVA